MHKKARIFGCQLGAIVGHDFSLFMKVLKILG